MISIGLLLKIIGGICFIGGWAFMYRNIRRVARRLECLGAHCDERLTAMAETVARMGVDDEAEKRDLAETRRKALEAEKCFTEGIANILNYSASTAAGRKDA